MHAATYTDLEASPLQALELRRWALTRLACPGTTNEQEAAATLDAVMPATWALFLATERCASALADSPARPLRALPEQIQTLATSAATAELKRILAARSQLRTLSKLAHDTGCRPVLIRGGACLSEDRSFDLDDLDILLPPAQARTVAEALDAVGYRPLGSTSWRHLAGRSAPGALPIEIHVTADRAAGLFTAATLEDVRPIPGLPGLARLSPLEHAWSVLVHVTVDHSYRRGRIRDLLLLADALKALPPNDRADLDRRVADHPTRGAMDAQLAMARALNQVKQPIDTFENVALANYVLRVRAAGSPNLPGNLRSTASKWVFALLGGPTERRTVWAETTAVTMEPSRFPLIAWVQRRHPGLGKIWLRLFRLLRLPFALALAAPMVLATRRELRRAGLEPRLG